MNKLAKQTAAASIALSTLLAVTSNCPSFAARFAAPHARVSAAPHASFAAFRQPSFAAVRQPSLAAVRQPSFAAVRQPSFAAVRQPSFALNHPRQNEVLTRDNNINNRINNDRGYLGGNYGQLEQQDHAIAQQDRADAARNGGFITPAQQGQLNREENSLNREVAFDNQNNPFVQNHPARAQVLGRDANLNYQINKDEGHLNGNYGNLERQDQNIQHQEQADARQNGGYITQGEQRQLNREENHLQQAINTDYTP